MKRYFVTLLPVLLAIPDWHQNSVPAKISGHYESQSPQKDDIKPVPAQYKTEELISRLLSNYHYRKFTLNDSLSAAMFDRYIDEIDHEKLYFLASDLKSFEQYRLEFDNYLKSKELAVPFEMYNVFRNRYQERSEYIKTLLAAKEPFDYEVDESIDTDPEKAVWAKDTDALNDTWRKYLKSEALDLRLAGKQDSAVLTVLRDRYQYRDRNMLRIRPEQVFQTFMNSFAESVDPHTSYMAPSYAERFNQEMSQSVEGIGAVLGEDKNYVTVMDVIPGGPAFKGKQLQKEDKIIGVAQGDNGKFVDIVGWFVDDAVKIIKGPKTTVVRLQVIPAEAPPGSLAKEYRFVREKVKLEEQRARKEIVSIQSGTQNHKIGIIEVPLFYRDFEGAQNKEKAFSSTTRDVKQLISELQAEHVEGIVIDLRNNGGGSLTEAVSLTGLFIKKGPVVQVREGQGDIEVQSDHDAAVAYDGPLVVAVNRFSASASEIFAAAIQDYQRGVIVGEQTYGKGTVQTLIDLNQWLPGEREELGQLKLTVAKFYRINGSSTQLKGVSPDVVLPSVFKVSEYGEASETSALPWDQIKTSAYETTGRISSRVVTLLNDNHTERLQTEETLKLWVKTLEDVKVARENSTVSLLESKRKEEHDVAEKKRADMKLLGEELDQDESSTSETGNATPNVRKDIFMTETGRILVDLIQVSADPGLAGGKRK